MILAAILILCKLEGQDVKNIFGIHHFWIQHAQIDFKSHRYRFSSHPRCPYFKNRPCLWLRSANLYFAQRIFIWRTEFASGFSFLQRCWTNQINKYSPKGARSNHFLILSCSDAIFCIFLMPLDAERNSNMNCPLAQIWSLSNMYCPLAQS